MGDAVAVSCDFHLDLAESPVIAVITWNIGKRVVISALIHDGAHGLRYIVAAVKSLPTRLLGHQVHCRVLGVPTGRIFDCTPDESIRRDDMVVREIASIG